MAAAGIEGDLQITTQVWSRLEGRGRCLIGIGGWERIRTRRDELLKCIVDARSYPKLRIHTKHTTLTHTQGVKGVER